MRASVESPPDSAAPQFFAHSLANLPESEWEPLASHLGDVADLAGAMATAFGWTRLAEAVGRRHDLGKATLGFQDYLRAASVGGERHRGPDHSTAGARAARAACPGPLGGLMAAAIAGHHAGLANGDELRRRLDPARSVESAGSWGRTLPPWPAPAELLPGAGYHPLPEPRGFSRAFLTRMIFSCLVDADFLATEAFYARARGERVERGGGTSLETLRARLDSHLAGLHGKAAPEVNALRARVLAGVRSRSALPPGLFTLTVPTGGGKTLASLAFALDHARRHGLRRVIYVIPFTSIVEQTASVFRDALDTRTDVLEHHSGFDWERGLPADDPRADPGARDALAKLRRAAENWDAPIVVTTAVQFYESLFAHRPSRCRKLHNLAGSVIVLDEAQTLPLPVLRPCLAALRELAANYRARVGLCTATLPALRVQDGFAAGLEIDDTRELAPDPPALYRALRRVRVEVRPGKVTDAELAARFAEQPQMLAIVGNRAHAQALFAAIRTQPGAVHLSTLMCGRHRRKALAEARARLEGGRPVRIVSTSLIEAGVDISFPEVWRAVGGLDSIAQAAGRCNRNGLLAEGRVVVFEPAEAKVPHALEQFWQATRVVLRHHAGDLLAPEAITAYFQTLYGQRETGNPAALDATLIEDQPGVLPALARHAKDDAFPFRDIGETFRLIDQEMPPVLVPYDEEAERLLAALAAAERPTGRLIRALQPYVVTIPRGLHDRWLAQGVLRAAHPAAGEALLRLEDRALYDEAVGLRIDAPEWRGAENNAW